MTKRTLIIAGLFAIVIGMMGKGSVNDFVIFSLTGSVRRGAMTRLLYLANRANKDAKVID